LQRISHHGHPIVQNGCARVRRVHIPTFNVDVSLSRRGSVRSYRAIIFGTRWASVRSRCCNVFAKKHGLWLIEDCCDALGATIADRKSELSAISHLQLLSGHHITMGECCVLTNTPLRTLVSLRDWPLAGDVLARKTHVEALRWRLGLAARLHHKYIYSHMRYNLKATTCKPGRRPQLRSCRPSSRPKEELRGASGRSGRAQNHFVLPEASQFRSSWFGFPLLVRETRHSHART